MKLPGDSSMRFTLEDCLVLDVVRFHAADALRVGQYGSMTSSRGDYLTWSALGPSTVWGLQVAYTLPGGERAHSYVIPVRWNRGNVGGVYPVFECPAGDCNRVD